MLPISKTVKGVKYTTCCQIKDCERCQVHNRLAISKTESCHNHNMLSISKTVKGVKYTTCCHC